MTEKALPKIDGIQEILRGKTHVIAEGFFIEQNYPGAVTLTSAIITSLKEQRKQKTNNDPLMYILGFIPEQLQEVFEGISQMIREKHPLMEGIDGGNITILQLNAPLSNRFIDEETGVTMATLKKGEPAYPMHLTPAD